MNKLVGPLRSEAWKRICQCRKRCSNIIIAAATETRNQSVSADSTVTESQNSIFAVLPKQPGNADLLRRECRIQEAFRQDESLSQRNAQEREVQELPGLKETGNRELDRVDHHMNFHIRHAPQQQPYEQHYPEQESQQEEQGDGLLVSLLAAEAEEVLSGDTAGFLVQSQLVEGMTCHPARDSTTESMQNHSSVTVQGFSEPYCPAVIEASNPVAGSAVVETSANIEQTRHVECPGGLNAQLQWIREALILLRRIEDPQHVQLQRRRKAATSAGAPCMPATAPVPSQPTKPSGSSEASATAARTTVVYCQGSQGASAPGPRTNRVLYVQWVGAGGGQWGGRSDLWLRHRL